MENSPIVQTQLLIDNVIAFISGTPWIDIYNARLEILKEKASFPCELAIAGRVKAGKSSFLNALLGEDLAMVGTTETTATINFFRYGRPQDPMFPVKVVWDNGKEEWQSKAFLDSLQGTSKATLQRAQKIDHLEYFVENPILHNITLVDTPGTGALVQEHEQRVNNYLSVEEEQLRKKHNDQSVAIKDRADAVIIMTDHVPTAKTDELVARFKDNTSAFNSLGVMTKIDTENETVEGWNKRCEQYSSMLRKQLNTIIPVSAGVYRAVQKLRQQNRLEQMQRMLRQIPNEGNLFDELVCSSTIFLGDGDEETELFSAFSLSIDDRKALAEGLPWRVFYVIAKELYYNDVEEACKHLIAYSGMEHLKDMLEKQFFNRSRIIRCARIVNEVHSILEEIKNRRFYDTRFEVNNRDEYLKLVKESCASVNIKKALTNFIETNICTKAQYEANEKEVYSLIKQTEEIQQSFQGTDNQNEALILLERKQSSFRPNEIKELEWLFGKYADANNAIDVSLYGQRQSFWRARSHQVADSEIKHIIELAIHAYGTK